jgi:penicillin-binding protein 1A
MNRLLGVVAVLLVTAASPHTSAAETQSFWNLKPEHLRLLVASPQIMVTRTASGWDAYCRCPVVLKPHETPMR